MFSKNLRQEVWDLENRVKDLEKRERSNYVPCKICKHIVEKCESNKGKGEILSRIVDIISPGNIVEEDYIYYPYFCNSCKPKEESSDVSKDI